jgi:hypothetical protein
LKRFVTVALAAAVACGALAASAVARVPHVLRVGTYHGIAGQYQTIQAAVDAAKPHDVILVAPGDYKTTTSRVPNGAHGDFPAGVLVTTPDITLRGMNRNAVIVDGTKTGSACNHTPADQNYGPRTHGARTGLNGVMVWKADDVSIENLTACNFLDGAGGDGESGNQIWWNGGAGSGTIGGRGFTGEYLNATSTFFNAALGLKRAEQTAATYGIFSSNWDGGTWTNTYASNMNDSAYYIGACRQLCNQTIDNAWGEYSALGYSGSNSGGSLIVEYSRFDNNEDGFDANSSNADPPSPQNGECPGGRLSPITHTRSCWVFMHNQVFANNNPNVPTYGAAAAGPVGTGMSIAGGRYDTVMDNTFAGNGAWGVVIVPYPDTGGPCTGGVRNFPLLGQGSCLFDEYGNSLIDNSFLNNGFWGHPTNGAFAQINWLGGEPAECYQGNAGPPGDALNPYAAGLQAASVCSPTFSQTVPADVSTQSTFLAEVLCDDQVRLIPGLPVTCPSGPYPRATSIANGLHPLPTRQLPTMPDPCRGIPANPWCGWRK